jgi:hypothetical protein
MPTILPLSTIDARLSSGATHLIKVPYTDLTDTAGTAKTLSLITSIPANTLFRYVGQVLVTDFAGPSITELTAAVGYDLTSGTDDADGFQAATSICGAATEIDATPVEIGDVDTSTVDTTYGQAEADVIESLRTVVNKLSKLQPVCHNEVWDLEAVFTSTGANLSVLTAGEVWFLVALSDLDQLEKAAR